jgi:catechol 2,3-dioxygenase-like lactoylglutathione lyase family enzyme
MVRAVGGGEITASVLRYRHHGPVLDHVTITASDFARSLRFYDAALSALGMERIVELGDEEEEDAPAEVAAWGREGDAVVWLVHGPTPTGGAHVALRADSRAAVEAFHVAALAAGGRSQDAPRRWAIFRTGQFNAIVLDPDGNLVEAVGTE